jgi:proteasome lid subunit RPN8/RPN11
VRLKVNKEEALAKTPLAALGRTGRSRARQKMVFGQSAHSISRATLDTIIESAKETMPHEFAATMRARDGIIYELVLVPGTISGHTSALMQFYNLPPDPDIVGSVHSHPSGNYNPSEADRALFSKQGTTHLIIGFPFTPGSWRAYDKAGNRRRLEIVE